MKQVGELLANPIKEKLPPPNNISRAMWAEVWLQLIAMGHQFEIVGSTTCEYWRQSLADLDEESLRRGVLEAGKVEKGLTLGKFRKLCGKPVETPYHRLYKALPHKAMAGSEVKSRIAKMREELGI